MADFTIGEVAKRTGLTASRIRYYESVGVVPKPARRSGRRVYDEDWMKGLSVALFAQEAGFSIKEIRQLIQRLARAKSPPSKQWQKAAKAKLEELSVQKQRIRQMEQLLGYLLRCDCRSFRGCEEAAHQYFVPERGTIR